MFFACREPTPPRLVTSDSRINKSEPHALGPQTFMCNIHFKRRVGCAEKKKTTLCRECIHSGGTEECCGGGGGKGNPLIAVSWHKSEYWCSVPAETVLVEAQTERNCTLGRYATLVTSSRTSLCDLFIPLCPPLLTPPLPHVKPLHEHRM